MLKYLSWWLSSNISPTCLENHLVKQRAHTHSESISLLRRMGDAKKAFNQVSWPFLETTLQQIRIGNSLLQKIKALYNNPTARIRLHGTLFKPFDILNGTQKGQWVHQGPTFGHSLVSPMSYRTSNYNVYLETLVSLKWIYLNQYCSLDLPYFTCKEIMPLYGKLI